MRYNTRVVLVSETNELKGKDKRCKVVFACVSETNELKVGFQSGFPSGSMNTYQKRMN